MPPATFAARSSRAPVGRDKARGLRPAARPLTVIGREFAGPFRTKAAAFRRPSKERQIPEEGDLRRGLVQPPVDVPIETTEAEPARLVELAGRDVVVLRLEPDPRQPALDRPGDRAVHQGTADTRPPMASVHRNVFNPGIAVPALRKHDPPG